MPDHQPIRSLTVIILILVAVRDLISLLNIWNIVLIASLFVVIVTEFLQVSKYVMVKPGRHVT